MDCISFSKAFQDNMRALHLDAPSHLFSSLQTAVGTLSTMLGAIKLLGPTATVTEIAGATTALENLTAIGAVAASYYVGATIGSLIVATEGVNACRDPYKGSAAARYRAVARWIASRGLMVPMDMHVFIQRHPEVLVDMPERQSYAMRAWQAGAAK
jgi:hypothetical protein